MVDDDKVICETYRDQFERAGFDFEFVHDAPTAMATLEASPPDLVLLDLYLPKISGVEVLKHIRSAPSISHLPVIVLSVSTTSRHVDAAWRAGANQCFGKDYMDTPRLFEEVRKCLEKVELPGAMDSGAPNQTPSASPLSPSGSLDTPAPETAGDSTASDTPQLEVPNVLLESGEEIISELIQWQRDSDKTEYDTAQLPHLLELSRKIQNLGSGSDEGCLRLISHFAGALEAATQDCIGAKSKNGPGSYCLLAEAANCLEVLLTSALTLAAAGREHEPAPPT